MKTRNIVALVVVIAAVVACQPLLAQERPSTAGRPTGTEKPAANTILSVAARDSSLSTFVAAVRAAGLTEKLEGEGPFTVFAPTNEAFANLPKGELDDLLKPANRARLAGILANHVVPGKLMAARMKSMKASNISGHDLAIEVRDGTVTVGGAKVVRADLVAGNGVIHLIDSVLLQAASMPKPESRAPRDHPGH